MKKLLPIIFILVFSLSVFGQQSPTPKLEHIFYHPDKTICSICNFLTVDGQRLNVFNAPEVGVAVSTSYTDKIFFATVYILNKSDNRIEFNPATDTVVFFYKNPDDNNYIQIKPLSPEEAAKKMKGNQRTKNFFTSLGAALQKQAITVDSATDGAATVIGSGGMATGIYNERTTSTILVPDTDAQRRAREKIDERNRHAEDRSNATLETALRANTIFPKKEAFGNVYFPLAKGGEFYFGVKIGNKVFFSGISAIK